LCWRSPIGRRIGINRVRERPIISVVIPCYNARATINQALQSVTAQAFDGCEVIVIDDGSTDGCGEAVESTFPQVKVVRTPNQGPSRARNLGTQLARGEFVQYLDADDILAAGKLRLQLEALDCSHADVAYGDWQKFGDHKGEGLAGEVVSRKIEGSAEIALFTEFWCPPAAYLFRRSIVNSIGGWNEGLPIIQDARFALDCALHGGSFVYTPGIMAYYRVHSSGSVSTRDPVSFVRDCARNAAEVEQWWVDHGGVTESRRKALLKVYSYTARASFERDRSTFQKSYSALKRLKPGYTPEHPRHLALASRLMGYPRAEALAVVLRRIKRAGRLPGLLYRRADAPPVR